MTSCLRKASVCSFAGLLLFLWLTSPVRAIDKRNSQTLAHYIMGSIYERSGDIAKAIEEYERAASTDAGNTLIHIRLAAAHIKNDDTQKAVGELKIAATLNPEAVEPHVLLALLYSAQGQLDLATGEYEAALKNASKLEPKNIDIYRNLGTIYLHQKKFKEAEGVYKIIIELAPNDAEAHFYLGDIYERLGNNIFAEKELKRALELKPDYAEALNYLGYMYVEAKKNLSQAETMIKKALAIDPNNGAYVDSLGWLYFTKGRIKEALKELEKAVSLLEDPVIYDHLGDAYLKLGKPDLAEGAWQRSLELNPDQPEVRNKLEQPKKAAK